METFQGLGFGFFVYEIIYFGGFPMVATIYLYEGRVCS